MAVGKAIDVSIKEEDISTSHPLPSYNSDAPPKIIVKFTRRDVRNAFYANRRKLIKIKTNALPDLGLTEQQNICISESLTPFKKKLFGEANKIKKVLDVETYLDAKRQDLCERSRKNQARYYRLVRRPRRI